MSSNDLRRRLVALLMVTAEGWTLAAVAMLALKAFTMVLEAINADADIPVKTHHKLYKIDCQIKDLVTKGISKIVLWAQFKWYNGRESNV